MTFHRIVNTVVYFNMLLANASTANEQMCIHPQLKIIPNKCTIHSYSVLKTEKESFIFSKY